MKRKECLLCGINKSLDNFYKINRRSGKYAGNSHFTSRCKLCIKISSKKIYKNNPEKYKQKSFLYRQEYKDILRQKSKEKYQKQKNVILIRNRKWRRKNRNKLRIYERKLLKENVQRKLSQRLRSRIRNILHGVCKKSKPTMDLIGCSANFLIKYLEIQFQPGMTWKNYGQFGWHIDHIIPCSAFDLTDFKQQEKCFHYTNLQPLWAIDNLSKGKTYVI